MYRSSLVTALAVAFAVMSLVLAGAAAASGNWFAIVPAVLFALTAYFMWYHASGRLADRVYRSVEGAATGGGTGGAGTAGGAGRGQTDGHARRERRTAAADGRGGFGGGPRADWERPGAESRERVRQEQARRRAARRERAREHARRVGGGGRRRRTRADVEAGMTAREAAEVLGVAPDADAEAVRSAYRDRIKEVHPDTDGGDEDQFKRVRDAYERLQE